MESCTLGIEVGTASKGNWGAGCLLGHVGRSGWGKGQGNGQRSVSIKCLAKALLPQPGACHLSPQTGLPAPMFLLASDCYWGHEMTGQRRLHPPTYLSTRKGLLGVGGSPEIHAIYSISSGTYSEVLTGQQRVPDSSENTL